jgi:capsular exopolysaccharide synthesis family protein
MMYRPEQNFPAQDNPEHRIPQFAGDILTFHRLTNLLRAKAWTDIPGLTDLLSGQIPLDDALRSTNHKNLVLLPAGRRALDPAQLLDSKEFGRILDQLLCDFDRVVIDSPRVNAVSDVLLIAAFVDATCLTIRAGKTPKKAIFQMQKARARIAGFVFNRLPVGGRGAGYYYYYHGDRYAKNGAYRESEAHSSSGAPAQ